MNVKKVIITQNEDCAKLRNKLIEEAVQEGYCYLEIIYKSLKIIDDSVTEKYIELMCQYNLGVVFYGFATGLNKAMGKWYNPMIICTRTNGKKDWVVRSPARGYILFDLLKIKDIRFDETLSHLDYELFFQDCARQKIIPFNGFFFELCESWKYFIGSVNYMLNRQGIETEHKILNDKGIRLEIDKNMDEFIVYMKGIENGNN